MPAPIETVHDDAVITIYWNPSIRTVEMKWKGFATSAPYRAALEVVLQTLVANRATRLISDMTSMKVVAQDDQAWTYMDWTPRIQKAGMRNCAMIMPASVIAKMSLNTMTENTSGDMNNNYVTTIEEARAWIARQ